MRENKRCGKYTRKHIQRNIKGIINFSEKNVNRVVEKKTMRNIIHMTLVIIFDDVFMKKK